MGALITAASRWLGADDERWSGVSARTLPTGSVVAVSAAVLLAFDRFGGASFQSPRAFVRTTLIGVWGWVGLGAGIVLVGAAAARSSPATSAVRRPSLAVALAGAGLAHKSVLLLGGVLLVSGGMLDVLGPGRITAVVVFTIWFPANLVAAMRRTNRVGVVAAIAMTAPVYLVWWLLVGDRLVDRVAHLL